MTTKQPTMRWRVLAMLLLVVVTGVAARLVLEWIAPMLPVLCGLVSAAFASVLVFRHR